MKVIIRRTIQVVLAVLLVLGVGISLQGTSNWHVGDVFVAIGNGRYNVYDHNGVFKETITDGSGNGFTTGCAFDSTYHLFTTNFSNTKVFKFAISPPHGVIKTIDTNVTSPGGHSESIVFDGHGNFFVGHPDGNTLVHKYAPDGTPPATFAPAPEARGTDWIDLTADGNTLFYTSEGQLIKKFDLSTPVGSQLPDFANLTSTIEPSPTGATESGFTVTITTTAPHNLAAGFFVTIAAVVESRYNGTFQVVSIPSPTTFTYTNTVSGLVNSGGGTATEVAKLFALRLLPPGDGSGGLLVADTVDIKRLDGSGNVIQTYSVSGESSWFSLNLDPNKTSFWAGNSATGNFYRFNIISGAVEVGPIATGAPNNFFGLCLDGEFSAAQPAPTKFSTTITSTGTPASSTATFPFTDSTGATNKLVVTLNSLSTGGLPSGTMVSLLAFLSIIDPAAGTSETNLPCTKTATLSAGTPQKCAIWDLEPDPNTIDPTNTLFSNTDLKLVGTVSVLTGACSAPPCPLTDTNTRALRNEVEDDTTAVTNIDPILHSGGNSIYSLNEVQGAANQGCAYLTPLREGAFFNSPGTIAFRFQCSALGTGVSALKPRISIVQFIPPAAPRLFFPLILTGQTVGPAPFYRLSDDGLTWVINVNFKGVVGCFNATTFDDNNIASAFSVDFAVSTFCSF